MGNPSYSLRSSFPGADRNLFLAGMKPTPGFSFDCSEIGIWKYPNEAEMVSSVTEPGADSIVTRARFTHPTGLTADLIYRFFADTNTLEFSGRFTNTGHQPLHNVRGPFALSFTSDLPADCVPNFTWVNGGASTEGCFPPPAYAVNTVALPQHSGKTLFGGRLGGRSCETEAPYGIVHDPRSRDGFFFVLEWPCRSISSVNRSATSIQVLSHVAYTGFDLAPGATLDLPNVILGFYRGDEYAGTNALRRHIVRHVLRPAAGERQVLPPVMYNHYYSMPGLRGDWTVDDLKREADFYQELGAEAFVVDAGWFLGDFRNGVGNWGTADPKRFPNGMEEISAYVRGKGMKFGAWLEPEFAMVNTQWLREHPDWFHSAGTRQNLFYGTRRFTDYLLKLERGDVRQFLADFMVKWVERYHLEWMRWDFNDGPAPFWEANETNEADCGRLQVGFGEGLMAVLDDVMRRCPQLHIEACAGGGHRMDLGTLRRAHAAWMNDNSYSIEAIRCYAKGVNTILPGCFADSAFLWQSQPYCPQSKEDSATNGYSRHLLRSRMAGSLLFSEVSTVVTPAMKEFLKREIALYKEMRPYLMKDYYPLFTPRTLAEYDGWQFHDPGTGTGWALVFRVLAPKATVKVNLHGLSPRRRYRIEDVDSGVVRTVRGGSALTLRVPEPNGTVWLRYAPVG